MNDWNLVITDHERRLPEALDRTGPLGRPAFDDPDRIIAVETVGQRAGFSSGREKSLSGTRHPLLVLV